MERLDIPMKYYWKGNDIESLSKDELIAVVIEQNDEIKRAWQIVSTSARMGLALSRLSEVL